jgi:hypothetical protein
MTKAGLKCITPKADSYDYCCTAHDPQFAAASDPGKYRIKDIHKAKQDVVLEYRGNKDIYSGDVYTTAISPKDDQLNHVLELHTVRDCRDAIKKSGTGFDERMKLFDVQLRDHVVNEKQNLGFTSKLINAEKFRSVFNFAEDYKWSCVAEGQGLVYYLDNREGMSRTKWRKAATAIQGEMVVSYDFVCDQLHEEDAIESEMMSAMHNMFITGMKLK